MDNIDKFLEAIEQFCETIYQSTEILLANPFDLFPDRMFRGKK